MHIRTYCFALLSSALLLLPWAAEAGDNVAYKDNKVRITVITGGLVRLEYSPEGKFTDEKTMLAVSRDYPEADFKVKDGRKALMVTTDRMVIKYLKGTGAFSPENLTITSPKGAKKPFSWVPGQEQKENLKGTFRTLDGFDGIVQKASYVHDSPKGDTLRLEKGLLARDGWTLISDSHQAIFDEDEFAWLHDRDDTRRSQDWYFMAYGDDYKTALRDFTLLAGKSPMPPRYSLGFWWSRYWSYSDHELSELVRKFRMFDVPLSVLVVDIDWHIRDKGAGNWTGMSFNKRLFPDPAKFFDKMHNESLKVTLNVHPGSVESYEDHYADMAKWCGVDPATKKPIRWNPYDKTFMTGWLNTQLRPIEKLGNDFWWLDWQTAGDKRNFPNMTFWLNYSVFRDMEINRNVRPFLYGRWGGLGSHRYPMGFSGDTVISWESLDFQPYFNTTAANVLYGYWSHDIGGHMMADHIDPELYVRWMQFGVLSPFLRVHTSKSTSLFKEPWLYSSENFDILRNIIVDRYRLVPYIYTMARTTYDEGLAICRPLYYYWPEEKNAYDFKNEYMFGDNMLVCPITSPMQNGVSNVSVWLPEGNDWYEASSGTLLKGGQTVERDFHIDEYPLYVKAGSIIPMYGEARDLSRNDEPITVVVFPGGNGGTFSLYEDGGNDKGYAEGFARTQLRSERSGNILKVSIGKREGKYDGMPETRRFTVKLPSSTCPEKVTVDGVETAFEYKGYDLAVIIPLPEKSCAQEREVVITYPAEDIVITDGLLREMRRTDKNITMLKNLYSEVILNETLGPMGSLAEAIEYHPENFRELVTEFRKNYRNFPEVLKSNGIEGSTARKMLRMK